MRDKKLVASIREAIIASGLKDGMTISFHHHMPLLQLPTPLTVNPVVVLLGATPCLRTTQSTVSVSLSVKRLSAAA